MREAAPRLLSKKSEGRSASGRRKLSAVGFLNAKGIAAHTARARIRLPHMPELAAAVRERLAQTLGRRYLIELDAINQRLREEIAQREQVEQRLQECEANLHRIADIAADAIAITRFADSTLIEVNHGFERLGYRRQDMIDRTWAQLGIWPDARLHEEFGRRLAADGSVRDVEMTIRRRDGASIPVVVSGVLIEINGETCAATVMRNMNAPGRAETAPPAPCEASIAPSGSEPAEGNHDDADVFQPAESPNTIQTPASDAAEAANERVSGRAYPPVAGRALRILLVEDSTDNRLVLRTYLRRLSCEIDEAENGEVAMSKFVAGSYDIVLMDLHMPVMNGITATRKIREWEERHRAAHTWVIALTASAFDDELRRMREAGADLELHKPIKKAALFDAIETLTGNHLEQANVASWTAGG